MTDNRLLCGTYDVQFVGRPNSGIGFSLNLPRGSHAGVWRGQLNGTARSEITVRCCDVPRLPELRSWGHYGIVTRTGYSRPLYKGPIVGHSEPELVPGQDTETVTIELADPTAWWAKVGLQAGTWPGNFGGGGTSDYITLGNVDSREVFRAMQLMSDSVNPGGIGWTVYTTGHPMTARYMRDEGRYLNDYIGSVTSHSVDWTVHGDQGYAGGFALPNEQKNIPASAWTARPATNESGLEISTFVEAIGNDDIRAQVGGADPFYGLHETFIIDDDMEDDASALRLATSTLAHDNVPPFYIVPGAVSLNSSAPVTHDDLVCGHLFTVDPSSKMRPGPRLRRLHSTETAWGFDGRENSAQPRFEPVGQVA